MIRVPIPGASLRAALAALFACAAAAAGAAVPVQESAPAAASSTATLTMQPVTDPGAADARRLSELFYQLQVLQQEVQDLRGLVEEQNYQLQRLARDQKEQYIDLDGRVAALVTGGAASRPSAPAPEGDAGAIPLEPSARPTAAPAVASASERDAYNKAFELMKTREFDASINAFNRLIADYPNGQFTPNAFYWLGELYLAKTETEQARQSFAQVVNLYPDHPKVPDTLYKLGVVYHRLGDTQRALDYFDQVKLNYPNSSAAGLASTYAAELR